MVAAVAAFLAGAGVSATYALDTLKISGTVVDGEGNPLPEAEVILTPAHGGQPDPSGAPLRAKANKKGKFTFAFAKPGEFLLTASHPGLVFQHVSVRMRDANKRPPLLPDGTTIEDQAGPVDPATATVPIGIPSKVFYVDLDLTLGKPQAPAAASAAPGPGAVVDNLKLEELQKAVADIQAGRFEEVIPEVDAILEHKEEITDINDLAALYYMKGYALVRLDRLAEAEEPLRAAVETRPELGPAWELLGNTLAQEKKYADAIEPLQKALDLTTEPAQRPRLLANLGKLLTDEGQVDRAAPLLEEAHQIAPDDSDITVLLIDAYTRLGRTDEADQLISPDLKPADAAVLHFNIAANMYRNKNWSGAQTHFEKSIELDPTIASAHRYLADTLLTQGDREGALAELQAYLDADPNAPDGKDVRDLMDAIGKDMPKKKK